MFDFDKMVYLSQMDLLLYAIVTSFMSAFIVKVYDHFCVLCGRSKK